MALTRASLAALSLSLAALALAAPPAAATCPVEVGPVVTAYHYEIGGTSYDHLDATNTHAGDTVTVVFTLTGCGEEMLSFVAYNATADHNLPDQTVYSFETGTFAAGEQAHNLTITVPPCFFQIDFVYGDVIEHFEPEQGGTYHAQGRFIDGFAGGEECETTTTTTTTTESTTGTTTEIPVFPSATALALGVGGAALGALFLLRRRL